MHYTYCIPQQQVVVGGFEYSRNVTKLGWKTFFFFFFPLRALLQSRNLHIITGIKLVSTFLPPPVIVLNKPICPDEWWQPLEESQHLFHFCTSVKSPFFYVSDVLIQWHLISDTAAPTTTTAHKRKESKTNKWTEMKDSPLAYALFTPSGVTEAI